MDQITLEELKAICPGASESTLRRNMDSVQVRAMVAAARGSVEVPSSNPVDLECKLHTEIIKYCDAQWPKWKYIHARMDKRATIGKGVQDFTIFAPDRVLCIECKARDKKLEPEQLAWAKEMEMLGYTVHCIRSWEEFERIVKG